MVQPAMMICACGSICAFGVSPPYQGAALAALLTQRSGAGGIGVDLIGKNGVELASVTGRGPVEAKADSPVKSKDRTDSAPGIFLSPYQDKAASGKTRQAAS